MKDSAATSCLLFDGYYVLPVFYATRADLFIYFIRHILMFFQISSITDIPENDPLFRFRRSRLSSMVDSRLFDVKNADDFRFVCRDGQTIIFLFIAAGRLPPLALYTGRFLMPRCSC